MSYEIVRSISIKKDGNIYITGACNNVRPLYYSTWNYSNVRPSERLFSMFTAIMDGNYHLQPSVSKKIRYAIMKTNEYIVEHALSTYDIFCDTPKYKYEKLAKEMGIEFTFKRHDYSKEYDEVCEKIRHYFYDNYSKEEQDDLSYESEHKAYDEIYEVFLDAYNNYKDDKKKWVIQLSGGTYLTKLNEKTYRHSYSLDRALVLDSIRVQEMICQVKFSCDSNAKIIEYMG